MHDAEKPKPGPHANGVVGFVNYPTIEYLVKQIHQLSIKHYMVEAEKTTSSPQNANVFAQTSQKGNQQPGGKKKRRKKGEGNQNKQKTKNNADGEKKKRRS